MVGPDRRALRLATLWEEQPLVLAFLRHFGCPFCLRVLSNLVRGADQFTARGARIAAVTMGAPDDAAAFCAARAPGILCLSDPARDSFRAYGLGRAGGAELLHPEVMVEGMRAAVEGHLPGIPAGDVLQMPGTFVIDTDGRVRLAYYSRTISDHPDNQLLLVALP